MLIRKKGVSLIAVLLFMMIATIAATATFKWLTSENKSSASRMMKQESYLAAIAGIESARSWITFHANDAGDLVRQYFANDPNASGNRPPIAIPSSVLTNDLQNNQTFNVWLTGVGFAENGTYKFKILSEGSARNSSKHRETAILNVSGLYQVDSPVEIPPLPTIHVDFEYTYFGGSTKNNGTVNPTAMLVNGDWEGNPNIVEKNFVVTGNAKLSGAVMEIKGISCIGGDLFADNGYKGKGFFVAGNVKDFKSAKISDSEIIPIENAYVKGDFIGIGSSVLFNNFSIEGSLIPYYSQNTYAPGPVASAYTFKTTDNLCLAENAKLKLPYNSQTFYANGNVWMPGHSPLIIYGDNLNQIKDNEPKDGPAGNNWYKKIILGGAGHTAYLADGHAHSEYAALRQEKTFNENKEWRKHCNNGNSPVRLSDGGACYDREYSYYSDSRPPWAKWGGQNYSPYVDVKAKDKLFYFYESGIKDVDFKLRTDDAYWKHDVNTGTPYWRWETAPYGAYFVGGGSASDQWQQYYNFGSAKYNYFNWEYVSSTSLWVPAYEALTATPYCKKKGDDPEGKFRPECHVGVWFTSNATLIPNQTTKPSDINCGDELKQSCLALLGERKEGEGCKGKDFTSGTATSKTNYKVDDMLVTGIQKFREYADKGCAADITEWTDNLGDLLNRCYAENIQNSTKARENLYNGYLVVNLKYMGKKDPKTPLKGKFIIIVDDEIGDLGIPPTNGPKDFVFLYFTKGGSKAEWGQTGSLAATVNDATYNYFIYTVGNMASLLMHQGLLAGSLYAQADECAAVENLHIDKMNFNADLMASLTSSGVLCNYDPSQSRAANESACGGNMSAAVTEPPPAEDEEGSGSTTGSSTGSSNNTRLGKDAYHISVAPQLSVSIETQYKAKEEVLDDQEHELAPSIIVLPRIIYLPTNPKGRLHDYYNVLNLNGATEEKDPLKVSCTPTIPVSVTLPTLESDVLHTCLYRSNTYGDIPFYVQVLSTTTEAPLVSLVDLDAEHGELVDDGEVTVSVRVPKSSHGEQISFDVVLTDIPDNWEVESEAGVEERIGSSSGKRYTVTLSPSSSMDQIIPLFKVRGGADATDGRLFFTLATPAEGCNIGTNTVTVFKAGHIVVQRKSLKEYCQSYEDDDICSIYSDGKNPPECNTLLSAMEWVTASGPLCSVMDLNNKWNCKNNKEIKLKGVLPVDKQDLCEVRIPNVSVATEDDPPYLYASAIRKTVTLTINMTNATNANTKVILSPEEGNDAVEHTCEKEAEPCAFTVYAGFKYGISVETGSGDKFSYYKCSGVNCADPNDKYNAEMPMPYPTITGDNTITVVFNEKDKCFYEDFSDMSAFCDGSSTKCVDICNENLSKGAPCAPKNSKYTGSDWLMMFNNAQGNGGISVPPKIGSNGSSSYIYTNNTKNADNQNGTQSVILSTVDAGSHGQMTAMFQTKILKKADGNDYLNSGLIFRSNGTESLILNVFGLENRNTVARICKITGHSINNFNSGMCEYEIFNDLTISSTDMVKVSLTLNGDEATITLNIRGNTSTKKFDISRYNTNDANHKYVGFDLSDDGFNLYDIGWQASGVNSCFNSPTVKCSFKANYLGGRVPHNENVTPWLSKSSFYTEHNCETEYYYNGNDNSTSYQSTDYNGIGNKLNATYYNFLETGPHGTSYPEVNPTGTQKDAKVKMSCPGTESSLEMLDPVSCGAFWVGDLTRCSSSPDLTPDVGSGFAGIEKEISIGGVEGVNLRGANLAFDIEWSGENNITVYLVSKGTGISDVKSLSTTISEIGNGKQTINIEYISNKDDFDPEHVTKIILLGTSSYNVKAIKSICPFALKVDCGSVDFTPSTATWTIPITIGNAQNAKCSMHADNSNIESFEEVNCPADGLISFTLKNKDRLNDFLETLNTNGLDPIKFTIKVKDGDNEDYCSPEPKTEAVTEAEKPTCTVSPESVQAKSGIVPTVSFTLHSATCPSAGCPYTVKFDGEVIKSGNAPAKVLQTQDSQKQNSKDEPLSAGKHYYTVTSYGKSGNCEFEVNPATEAVPECDIEGNFLNIAVPNGASYSDVKVQITVSATDALGIPVGSKTYDIQQNATPGLEKQQIDLKTWVKQPGKYRFHALGSSGYVDCDGLYEIKKPAPTFQCSTSPETQDPNNNVVVSLNNVQNCESGCTWEISGVIPASGNYADGIIKFKDTYAANGDEKTYRLTLSNGTPSSPCELKVSYQTPEVIHPSFDCPSGEISVSNQLPSQNVSINLSNVTGCTDGCSWHISGGATASGNLSGTSFSFAHDNGTNFYLKLLHEGKYSDECNVTVSYKQKPTYTCPDDTTVTKGTNFAVIPTGVQNCTPGCKYSVKKDGSTTVLNRDEFTYTSGKIGDVTEPSATTKTYSLTLTNDVGAGDECTFDVTYKDAPILTGCIAWVRGTGNYGGHCYNSGLSNMNGKCYKCNPDRGNDCNLQWLNDDASQSYWWQETPCDGSGVTGGGSGGGGTPGGSPTLTSTAVDVGVTGLTIACESKEKPILCACPNIQIQLDGVNSYKTQDWQTCDNFQTIGKCGDLEGKKLSTASGTVKCKNSY